MNPFQYTNGHPVFNQRLLKQNGSWRHYAVDFPVAFPNEFQDSNTTYGEYFQPLNKSSTPLVILIHGWGDHSTIPMYLLARALLKRGIASFILYLPFHSRRFPQEMKSRRYHLSQDEWFAGYRIGVTDISQIVDWANTMKEVNHDKIAVIGLSLGAFMGSIAMGIDERIKAGIFIVSGGNSGKIMQFSRFNTFRKGYKVPTEEYERYQKSYLEYLDKIVLQGWGNVLPERQNFFIDPLTYAHRLRERPVLMINARWDDFIPREATLDFWKACGEQKILWLPATHASIWIWYPIIAGRIYRFLKSYFEPTA
jgi:pimeloyl-ACP methyl ester carboxylesterase